MKKILICLFITVQSFAGIKFYWLGTSTCIFTDGKTTIAFDAFITRYGLLHLGLQRPVISKKEVVDKWLKKVGVKKLDSIFINHNHFDHILDLGNMAKYGSPRVYVSPNGKIIAKSQGVAKDQIFSQTHGEVFKSGDFQITALKGKHAAHVMGHVFFGGKIDKKNFSKTPTVSDYKNDEGFGYYLEHPKGNILFWPSSNIPTDFDPFEPVKKVDVLIQGIALRKSSEFIYDKIVKRFNPKGIIPVHYDGIFHTLEDGVQHLMGVDLEEFISTGKKMAPKSRILLPEYGEEVKFFY